MIAQTIMNGLIAGSMIGLGAIGITLTYSILRFANFAHGDMISWAAYFALAVSTALGTLLPGVSTPIGPFSFGWSLPLGLIAAIALTGLLTLMVDWLLFGKLRQRGGAVIILVMAGFGAALSLRSFLEFVFTSRPTYFTDALQIAMPVVFRRAAPQPDQMLGLGLAVVLVALVHLALTRTAAGRAMRAVSENQALAGLAGVNVSKTIRLAWLFGAALAAVAGVMAGLLVQIRPHMGHDLLLPLFAAAILGGIGSVPGAMVAGLIIGLSEALCVQFVGAEWRGCGFVCRAGCHPVAASARVVRKAGGMIELISYGAFFLTLALTFAIMCLGLNVQWGQTGLFNVGVAGFVGIGAYVSALVTTPDIPERLGGFGWPIAAGLDCGCARWCNCGGPAGGRSPFGCGLIILRSPLLGSLLWCNSARSICSPSRADHLASASFPGPLGIWQAILSSLVCSISLLSLPSHLAFTPPLNISRGAPGAGVLRAIREDEQAATALGKNAISFRIQAFAIGGAIMGLARVQCKGISLAISRLRPMCRS